jgi:hypothetical protein
MLRRRFFAANQHPPIALNPGMRAESGGSESADSNVEL